MFATITESNRGFARVEFTDHNNVECSLQQSSAIDTSTKGGIDNPGSSFVWLGCNNADPVTFIPGEGWHSVPMPEQYTANTRMHLDRDQVKELIQFLKTWLKTGDFTV